MKVMGVNMRPAPAVCPWAKLRENGTEKQDQPIICLVPRMGLYGSRLLLSKSELFASGLKMTKCM